MKAADRALAETLLAAWDGNAPHATISGGDPEFDMDRARAAARAIRAVREARGERQVGRKIGFTNRTIWPVYNVHAPIWGDMWDTTVTRVAAFPAHTALPRRPEPRVEPEVVFGIARAPKPDMDVQAIAACLDWVAPGFEVVTSVFPGWVFTAPDTQAAFGLHAALIVAPPQPISALGPDPVMRLTNLRVTLTDGLTTLRGEGKDVLDGPVQALGHLVRALHAAGEPPLAPGETVTTGTLTDAVPLLPGARWRAVFEGAPFPDLDVTFA